MITKEVAEKVFRYDPETGYLFRRKRDGKRAGPEKKVGNPYSNGYLRVSYGPKGGNKEYLVHRLVWLMHTGAWPEGEIDHINGDRQDNRIANLRCCTSSENKQNIKKRKNNKSGYTGVSLFGKSGRWRADLTVNKKATYLGSFETPEEAYSAYLEAKSKLHQFNPVPRGTMQRQ